MAEDDKIEELVISEEEPSEEQHPSQELKKTLGRFPKVVQLAKKI